MRWADVRFAEASVVLREHKTARKTGRPPVIPLVPTVIKLLLWMRAHRQAVVSGERGHVFTNGRGNPLSRGWLSLKMQRLRRRLGLPDGVTLYGLRHRYGLMGIKNGVNLKLLSLCMGHARTQMARQVAYGGLSRSHHPARLHSAACV
jgi:site-specific recombinase XerD